MGVVQLDSFRAHQEPLILNNYYGFDCCRNIQFVNIFQITSNIEESVVCCYNNLIHV